MLKVKVITFATSPCKDLEDSLIKFGYDYIILVGPWKGFGTKVIETRKYLEQLSGYTHFIFVDAYDVIFIGPLDKILEKYKGGILFSAEKNCWPDQHLAGKYPKTDSAWKYLNSGSYMAPIAEFLELTERLFCNYEDDDQRYFTNIFLYGNDIQLDYNCEIFQSIAFCYEDELTITDHLKNNWTNTLPVIIHGNGKADMTAIKNINIMNNISELNWQNTAEYHQGIHEGFIAKVNGMPELKAHRDFVETNIFGFGERSFLWLWWLLIKEMPASFTFMEIGVFKGQILSLIRMVADMQAKKVVRHGVTPLSSIGGVWESDYEADIKFIHDQFKIKKDYKIIKGDSTDPQTIKAASEIELDILYVDGGHTYDIAKSDIENYSPLIKSGGYLVIDDCCNDLKMPFGYFQGIESVTRAVNDLLPNKDFEFVFSVVHIKVFRRR